MAAARLRLPEAVVASALPDGRGVGVSGNEFSKVWDSLGTWGDALTLVDKGGSIFEIRGRIPAGKPSEKSRYFNLNGDGLPLAGHLRPDLLGAIYAVELAGADAPVQGVIFLDQQGQGVFGVYVPAEGGKPAPETMADFRRTRDLMSRLAPLCPPASG
jgi:hypothetical protein